MSLAPVTRLMDLATGYWAAAAIDAAVGVGLFDALDASTPRSAEAIAAERGLDPSYATALLDALVGLGLLDATEAGYAFAPDYASLLDRDSPRCMLDALAFNADLYPLWGRLGESVRTGGPAIPPGAHLGADAERTRRFVMGMHSRAMAIAPAILEAIDAERHRRLLDVGAGPGTFSRLLAREHGGLRVTQLDLPPVLAVARELAAGGPDADRIDFHGADYRRDALPTGFDAALYCGALHQETDASALALFGRLREALVDGGELYVIDLMLDDDRSTPAFAALFSINMKLFDPRSGLFTRRRAAELLAEAGFEVVSTTILRIAAYSAVRARR